MLVNTSILTVSDSKDLENNSSASILLKKIQESKQIVSENKIVNTDKKKIVEILLNWLENNDLDIIIIINDIKTEKVDLLDLVCKEIEKNKASDIRPVQEFKALNYIKQKSEIKKTRSIFIKGMYIIELPQSKQAIIDAWNEILKVRFDTNNITLNNYIKNLKVEPYHLLYGQLYKKRTIDMKNELNKQIEYYLYNLKQTSDDKKFIFVEVGSYLGESLELWGELLEKKLKKNFLIISIDPYINYVTKSDLNLQKNKYTAPIKMSLNIHKAYMYFINNISLKTWRDKHIHFRMSSHSGFKTLKNFNIKIDFCYLDGSHYYKDFKSDLDNYSKILKLENGYKGKLCGDDYEISYNELLKEFKKEEVDKILSENKSTDFIEKGNFHFHPGITLVMHETKIKINKLPSGFWTTK